MSQTFQNPTIPSLIHQGARRFVLRSAKDRYIAELAGIPYEPAPGPDVLIPIKAFASALGVTVRSVERRVAAAKASLPAGEPAPAKVEVA